MHIYFDFFELLYFFKIKCRFCIENFLLAIFKLRSIQLPVDSNPMINISNWRHVVPRLIPFGPEKKSEKVAKKSEIRNPKKKRD